MATYYEKMSILDTATSVYKVTQTLSKSETYLKLDRLLSTYINMTFC